MATYNGEKTIKSQIDSILIQLDASDEIIISDDGSSDGTLKILTDLNDPRIKIYQNKRKKGPSDNFINALTKVSGQYIFLSDQDDTWFENKVSKCIDILQTYDLVLSDAIVVNEEETIIYNSFFEQRRSKKGFINNIRRNSYIGCCMAFKKTLLDKASPFPENIHMHDWWLGLVAELTGKVMFYPFPLIKYVRHGNNASPTLENSNYSTLKRFTNRWVLFINSIPLLFK